MKETKKNERPEEENEVLTDKALDEVLGGLGDIIERPDPDPPTPRPPLPPMPPRWPH